jgi:hypothetical protein
MAAPYGATHTLESPWQRRPVWSHSMPAHHPLVPFQPDQSRISAIRVTPYRSESLHICQHNAPGPPRRLTRRPRCPRGPRLGQVRLRRRRRRASRLRRGPRFVSVRAGGGAGGDVWGGVGEGGEGALPGAQPGGGVEERGPAAGRDEAAAEAAET